MINEDCKAETYIRVDWAAGYLVCIHVCRACGEKFEHERWESVGAEDCIIRNTKLICRHCKETY